MTKATLSIIDNMVKDTTAAEILVQMEDEGKKSCAGTKNSLVWYIISGRISKLPCNY